LKSAELKQVYQFKIALQDAKPQIWRRIQVPETYTFWDLHAAIQDAMGWCDCHLHEFMVINPKSGARAAIGIPYEDNMYDRVILPGWKEKIADWLSLENNKAGYLYDFGDNWEHLVKLEKILPKAEGVKYPVCLAGKRACPPEDCGGIWGYEDLLRIISNPQDEEYEDMIAWIGGKFNPEFFEVKKVVFSDPKKRLKRMKL